MNKYNKGKKHYPNIRTRYKRKRSERDNQTLPVLLACSWAVSQGQSMQKHGKQSQ